MTAEGHALPGGTRVVEFSQPMAARVSEVGLCNLALGDSSIRPTVPSDTESSRGP